MDVRIVQGVALQQARYRVGRRHQQTLNPKIDRRDFPVYQLHARSFKACAMSAIRSDGCLMPIDSRIVESRTPIFWRISSGTPEWVMVAGRLASDSVPPRLTANLKICSAFKNLKAAACPPTMSNANVEPAPLHWLANTRPAGVASSRWAR